MPILFFSSLSFLPGTDPELWRTHRSNVLSLAVVSYYLYVRGSFFLTPLIRSRQFFFSNWNMTKNKSLCLLLASFFFLLILPCKVLIECAFIVECLLPFLFFPLTLILLGQLVERGLHCHRLELQVHDLQQHIKQMIRLTALQDQENKRMQK